MTLAQYFEAYEQYEQKAVHVSEYNAEGAWSGDFERLAYPIEPTCFIIMDVGIMTIEAYYPQPLPINDGIPF